MRLWCSNAGKGLAGTAVELRTDVNCRLPADHHRRERRQLCRIERRQILLAQVRLLRLRSVRRRRSVRHACCGGLSAGALSAELRLLFAESWRAPWRAPSQVNMLCTLPCCRADCAALEWISYSHAQWHRKRSRARASSRLRAPLLIRRFFLIEIHVPIERSGDGKHLTKTDTHDFSRCEEAFHPCFSQCLVLR